MEDGRIHSRGPELHPLLLAGLAGAAYSLAFPPFDLPGVAWVVLAPLFALAASLPPARAAVAGGFWALAATASVAPWLPATASRALALPEAAGWLVLLGVAVAPVGLVLAALCAFTAWAAPRGAATPLALGAAFGLTELARTSAWPPVPWALLGASALPEDFFQAADVLGGYGLGIAVASCNAALACALVPALRTRRAAAEALALVLLVAAIFGYGRLRAAAPAGAGTRVAVAVVQPGAQESGSDAQSDALALTRALRDRGHDLIVWPERALAGYLRERTPASDAVLALSRELPGDLVLGADHYLYAEPEPRYFASAFLLRGGALVGRHDKTRLVPFAEAAYVPGERVTALPGARAPVGALVCAELLFPKVARELARGGAELLANPSNDAWLAPAASLHLLRVARLRAIENRRALLRSTPTGVSAVIDARGRTLRRAGLGTAEVLEASVRTSRTLTPNQRFGDWPAALAVLVVAGATLRGLRGPRLQRSPHA